MAARGCKAVWNRLQLGAGATIHSGHATPLLLPSMCSSRSFSAAPPPFGAMHASSLLQLNPSQHGRPAAL